MAVVRDGRIGVTGRSNHETSQLIFPHVENVFFLTFGDAKCVIEKRKVPSNEDSDSVLKDKWKIIGTAATVQDIEICFAPYQ